MFARTFSILFLCFTSSAFSQGLQHVEISTPPPEDDFRWFIGGGALATQLESDDFETSDFFYSIQFGTSLGKKFKALLYAEALLPEDRSDEFNFGETGSGSSRDTLISVNLAVEKEFIPTFSYLFSAGLGLNIQNNEITTSQINADGSLSISDTAEDNVVSFFGQVGVGLSFQPIDLLSVHAGIRYGYIAAGAAFENEESTGFIGQNRHVLFYELGARLSF